MREYIISLLLFLLNGAISIILPLYLLELNLNIREISFIYSFSPLTLLLFRFLFSIFGDYLGTRKVFLLMAFLKSSSFLIFYFSQNIFDFVIGIFLNSIADSSYWSVIRTNIYKINGDKSKQASLNWSFISFGYILGFLIAGLLSNYLNFKNSFLILFSIPVLMMFYSFFIKDIKTTKRISEISFIKNKSFWKAALILSLYAPVFPFYGTYMTIFLNEKNFNVQEISNSFIFFELIFAISIIYFLKYSSVQLKFFIAILTSFILILLPFSDKLLTFVLISTFYFGDAARTIFFESLTAISTKRFKRNISFILTLFLTPTILLSFVFYHLYGYFGIDKVLIISSISLVIFSILSYKKIL